MPGRARIVGWRMEGGASRAGEEQKGCGRRRRRDCATDDFGQEESCMPSASGSAGAGAAGRLKLDRRGSILAGAGVELRWLGQSPQVRGAAPPDALRLRPPNGGPLAIKLALCPAQRANSRRSASSLLVCASVEHHSSAPASHRLVSCQRHTADV